MRPISEARRQSMRKIALAVATILVFSGTMFAKVTEAQSQMVNGQVTKIDEAAGKITLKHGPIKKLDMDEPMTMVFRVQDLALLKQMKVGDKGKFDASRVRFVPEHQWAVHRHEDRKKQVADCDERSVCRTGLGGSG